MENPYDWGISKALCIMRERNLCLELYKTFLKLSYQTLAVQTHLTMKVRVVTSSSMNSYIHEDWAHISEGPFPATSLATCSLLFSSAPTLLGAPQPPHTHTPHAPPHGESLAPVPPQVPGRQSQHLCSILTWGQRAGSCCQLRPLSRLRPHPTVPDIPGWVLQTYSFKN